MKLGKHAAWGGLLCLPFQMASAATTYTVGPAGSGAQFTQLRDVFAQRNLAPGDIVSVAGNATYAGDVTVGDDDSGTPANPVVIRWNRAPGSQRPRVSGGIHTVKFQQSSNVVFEGFEVTGGEKSCIFNEANEVTVRDVVVQGCPAHGILGADDNSGSFTLEYSEVYGSGSGTQKHPIYMTSDEKAFPNAVFRMRFNYIHDGNGGNLVKVRHERSEIHYNWFENSKYQEIELIGPDCVEQPGTWSRAFKREDSELVGNVVVHKSSWPNVIRLGGDLNGASDGRVRMVSNTILVDRAGQANAVYVQLGLESLEMHDNVIYQTGNAAPTIVGENTDPDTPECAPFITQPWTSGRHVSGTHNWVETNATAVPVEWASTFRGADPGFANVATGDLRPVAGGPLVDSAFAFPPAYAAFPFPSPIVQAQFQPPLRRKAALNERLPRMAIPRRGNWKSYDIGALEARVQGLPSGTPLPLPARSGSAPSQQLPAGPRPGKLPR